MVRRLTPEVHKVIQSVAIEKADANTFAFIPHHPEQEVNIRLLGSVWARLRYADIKAAYEFDGYGSSYSANMERMKQAETKSDFFWKVACAAIDPYLQQMADILYENNCRESVISRRRDLEEFLKPLTANLKLLQPDTIAKILWVDQTWFQFHAEEDVVEAVRLSDELREHISSTLADVRKAQQDAESVFRGFRKASKAKFN